MKDNNQTLSTSGTGTGVDESLPNAMPKTATVHGGKIEQIIHHEAGHNGSTTDYVSCPLGNPIPGVY